MHRSAWAWSRGAHRYSGCLSLLRNRSLDHAGWGIGATLTLSTNAHQMTSAPRIAVPLPSTKQKKTPSKIVKPSSTESSSSICAAYCVNASLALDPLERFFRTKIQQGREADTVSSVENYADDAVHVMLGKDAGTKHALFFPSGAAVFWGIDMLLRQEMLDQVAQFDVERARGEREEMVPMVDFDHEFRFKVDGGRRAGIRNDELILQDLHNGQQLLTLSYGLSQSVKLLVYEEAVDRLVEETKRLPQQLAKRGRIEMGAMDIKKLMGELMAARYSVNLLSDILDTPEYFWSHPELEGIYSQVCGAVELHRRADILNDRVEVIKDALDILNNELISSNSYRVERAILFLIAVEVGFAFVNYFR